jgi:hypothetical protein
VSSNLFEISTSFYFAILSSFNYYFCNIKIILWNIEKWGRPVYN